MNTREWTPELGRLSHVREVRTFLTDLQAAAQWEGRLSRRNHIQLRLRDGRGPIITMPATPSDCRAIRNARAHCRRVLAGVATQP